MNTNYKHTVTKDAQDQPMPVGFAAVLSHQFNWNLADATALWAFLHKLRIQRIVWLARAHYAVSAIRDGSVVTAYINRTSVEIYRGNFAILMVDEQCKIHCRTRGATWSKATFGDIHTTDQFVWSGEKPVRKPFVPATPAAENIQELPKDEKFITGGLAAQPKLDVRLVGVSKTSDGGDFMFFFYELFALWTLAPTVDSIDKLAKQHSDKFDFWRNVDTGVVSMRSKRTDNNHSVTLATIAVVN